jgi:hypothetical protein
LVDSCFKQWFIFELDGCHQWRGKIYWQGLNCGFCGPHVFYSNYFMHDKKPMFFWIFVTQFIQSNQNLKNKSLLIRLFPNFIVATRVAAISWKFRLCGPTFWR